MKIEHEKEIIDEKNNILSSKKKNTGMLMAAFMIFIFPIIAIFIGVFIGGYIAKFIEVSIRMFQIIGGIAAFALSIVIIRLFDKSIQTNENAEKIYWDDL